MIQRIDQLMTEAELAWAADIAVHRVQLANERGSWHDHGQYVGTMIRDLERETRGVLGELACAKAMDLRWTGEPAGAIDVGGRVEVRSVPAEYKRLIIQKTLDRDDLPFVSALVLPPMVHLRGWMLGGDAKQEQHWFVPPDGKGTAAYFVKAEFLRPMQELFEWLDI